MVLMTSFDGSMMACLMTPEIAGGLMELDEWQM